MFTYHPDSSRVLVDDRRRALLLAATARHTRHELRRARRLRADP